MQILTTQNVQYLDTQSRSCSNGYIYVLDVKNLTELDVYTLTDSQYVKAANPIRLDLNGRPNQTYFTDALAYCRLYDAHDQFIREWYGSSNVDPVINDTVVYTVENLKKAALSLGTVTVVGYWSDYDCEARTYTWQADCTDTADDGQVIKSDLSESGRWLLLTDRAYIPSTYYGVYPGHEENMLKFLARSNTAYDITYPTCNFFRSGSYETAVGLATLHPVLLDRGVSFAASYVSAPSFMLVGKQTSDAVIGNLKTKAAVRSSWYETLDDMFSSGSTDMTIDAAKQMTQDVELKNVYLHGKHQMTYTWTGVLTLNDCYIDADVFTGMEWLKFLNMDFTDTYFYAKNTFSLTNIAASSVAALHTFKSADMYIDALQTYTDETVYRLEHRPVKYAHTFTKATEIHDLQSKAAIEVSNSCSIYDSHAAALNTAASVNVSCTDCVFDILDANADSTFTLIRCTASIDSPLYITQLNLVNSTLTGTVDASYTVLTASNSNIQAIGQSTISSSSVSVNAHGCVIGTSRLSNASLDSCKVNEVICDSYTSATGVRGQNIVLDSCTIESMAWSETWADIISTFKMHSCTVNSLAAPYTSLFRSFACDLKSNSTSYANDFDLQLNTTYMTATADGNYYITPLRYMLNSNFLTPVNKRADTVAQTLLVKSDYSVAEGSSGVLVVCCPITFDGSTISDYARAWTYIVAVSKSVHDSYTKVMMR